MASNLFQMARDGDVIGEYEEIVIQRSLDEGRLLPTDWVWREGFAEWRPILDCFAGIETASPIDQAVEWGSRQTRQNLSACRIGGAKLRFGGRCSNAPRTK